MTAKSKATAKKRAKGKTRAKTKKDVILALLRRKNGANISDLETSAGWQAHSVRGFLSGTVKKKLGLNLIVELRDGGGRRYFLRDAQ